MFKKSIVILFVLCLTISIVMAQNQKPKNIVLIVIDGFGMDHLNASALTNGGESNLYKLSHSGFLKLADSTNKAVNPVSAVSAIACGVKTIDGGLGKDVNKNDVTNILEVAKKENKSTGIVSTSSITYPSPAAFYAHQSSYEKEEKIASSILTSELDVFIGGGLKNFTKRSDDADITRELRKLGYKLYEEVAKLDKGATKKVAGLVFPEHPTKAGLRGDYLQTAWHKAFRTLIKDENGYFMVVNLTQIDWACQLKDDKYLSNELKDLEAFIEQVYKYVGADRETLLVITSSYNRGNVEKERKNGQAELKITDSEINSDLVPVFANGPGAENFSGVYKNTDLYMKLRSLLF